MTWHTLNKLSKVRFKQKKNTIQKYTLLTYTDKVTSCFLFLLPKVIYLKGDLEVVA